MQSTDKGLEHHGFILRKYSSNSKKLLDIVSSSLLDSGKEISILGIKWDPKEYHLEIRFKFEDHSVAEDVIRRSAPTVESQTFDPLGLFSPVLIREKILLQNLWLENKDWDDLASENFSRKFIDYINDLRN